MSDWKQNALTPKELCDSDMNYSAVDDLLGAIKHDEIKNIALAGPYGSGKSSILKTFIKKIADSNFSKDFKVLELSLGTLEIDDSLKENESVKEDKADSVEAEGTDNNADGVKVEGMDNKDQPSQQETAQADKDENEGLQIGYHEEPRHILSSKKKAQLSKDIECGILQQLIYRKKNENLPYSRFKKISHYSATTIRSIASYTIGYVICIGYAFNISFLQIPFSYDAINNLSYEVRCVAFIILIAMSYDILMKFIKTWGGKQLQKISVAGNDIEIKDDCSVFNTYFEEILYFFQCTDYNVVIFEDLDRFNYPEIFIKLRELNYLLNKSEMVGRPVKFIYAIKDDMFKNYSRAKFFDYIATVIPVITAYNSKNVLKEELNKLEHEEIPEDKLESIAFHIDDMRLLKNIVNEFDQYMKKLNTKDVHLDPAKMLAMITVKNYHPHDFSELQFRKGKLYAVLSPEARRNFINFAIKVGVTEKEKQANERLEDSKFLFQYSVKELRLIYLTEIRKTHNVQNFYINHNIQSDEQIISNEDLFDNLTQKDYIERYDNYTQQFINLDFNFPAIEKKVNPNFSYKERLSVLKDGTDKIKEEIKKIKEEKNNIENLPIKRLITDYSIFNEKNYKKLGLSDMEDDFIRRGLLDENYNEYISFNYSKSDELSEEDRSLYMNMELGKQISYDTIIQNIGLFVNKLSKEVFSYKSVWNIYLVSYLVNNKKKFENQLNTIVNSLIANDSHDFFEIFYTIKEKDALALFDECMKVNQEIMWMIACKKDEDTNNNIKMWLLTCECDIDKITDEQKKYIKMHYDLIASIYDYFDDKHKEFFVNSKLDYLELTERNDEMLENVLKSNNYAVNHDNMAFIVKRKQAFDDIAKLSNVSEMEDALENNAVNATWHNLNEFFKIGNWNIAYTIKDYIQRNIRLLSMDMSFKDTEYDDLFNSLQEEIDKFDDEDAKGILRHIIDER